MQPIKKKIFLRAIVISMLISGISVVAMLFFVDPEAYRKIIFFLFGFLVFGFGVSFLTLLIYFIKKIFFRGEVSLITAHNAFRQAVLVMLLFSISFVLYKYALLTLITFGLVAVLLIIFEVMIQVLEG